MARLAPGEVAPEPGWPPRDFREWLRANGLLDGDFGIPPDQWALQPPAQAYVGKRFNPVSRVWEPDLSLARGADSALAV